MAFRHSPEDMVPVVSPIGNDRGNQLHDLIEQGPEFGGFIDLLASQAGGDGRTGGASTPRCSFHQTRRRWVPCFSASHSPSPLNFTPVLWTSKHNGPFAVLAADAIAIASASASVPTRRIRGK